MGLQYSSICPTCNLCIDMGKDYTGIRHKLFELYHTHRFKDHHVERWNEEVLYEYYNHQKKAQPDRLYNTATGYIVQVPEWLSALELVELERSIKGQSDEPIEDVIDRLIRDNQERLLELGLPDYESRLAKCYAAYKERKESDTVIIELMPDQSVMINTTHGSFTVTERGADVNVFAVRHGIRKWIAVLRNNKVLKLGSEDNPKQ